MFQSDSKTASFLFQSRGKIKKARRRKPYKTTANIDKSSSFVPNKREKLQKFTANSFNNRTFVQKNVQIYC